ncbi:DUF6140 family protein [uncultured Tenacibaculum sp.]|uniref:DUF6140 family protein n=1 Tax=uncultured Tenacibaculum sp. TaxID=174713 RepID=UPI002631AA29|nr:DUF6140 family protein [uncultured Tenacibaculum sp.]
MATFTVELKQRIAINGEIFESGLSVQVSTLFDSPYNEYEKIENAFRRVHGITNLKANGFLNDAYLKIY